jgi:hypothetical protein
MFALILSDNRIFVVGTWDEMRVSAHADLHAYPKLMVRRASAAEVEAYHAEERAYIEAERAAERRACAV